MARVVLFYASPDEFTVRTIDTAALRDAGRDAWLDDQTLDVDAPTVERGSNDADLPRWPDDAPLPPVIASLPYLRFFPAEQAFLGRLWVGGSNRVPGRNRQGLEDARL